MQSTFMKSSGVFLGNNSRRHYVSVTRRVEVLLMLFRCKYNGFRRAVRCILCEEVQMAAPGSATDGCSWEDRTCRTARFCVGFGPFASTPTEE